MAVTTHKTGPGTLSIGDTPMNIEAQVTSCAVTPEEDAEDDVVTLSGDTVSGDATYTATLAVTCYQDLDSAGIVAFSWEQRGQTVAFEFTPNSSAGATISGQVRVVPLTVGGEVDVKATSEFEWTCVGFPEYASGESG